MKNEKTSNYQIGDDSLLKGYVNSEKAKQLLNCGTTTLYYMRKKRQLTFSKVNRKVFYELASITKIIEANKVQAS